MTTNRRNHGPGSRTGIGTAIIVALAVTAGPLALAAPAAAADAKPASATTAEERQRNQNLPRLTKGSEVVAAGQSGYLSESPVAANGKRTLSWVRTADGSATPLKEYEGRGVQHLGAVSDIVVLPGDAAGQTVTLTDLSAGAPGTKTVLELPAGYRYLGAVGATVVAAKDHEIRLLAKSGDTLTDRGVIGSVPGTQPQYVAAAGPGHVVVGLPENRLLPVDLAAATASPVLAGGRDRQVSAVAVSATHTAVVWEVRTAPRAGAELEVVNRATGVSWKNPIPHGQRMFVGLTGDKVVHGPAYDPYERPTVGRAATVVTPVNGNEGTQVLDRGFALAPAADGTLLVSGGSVHAGDGVYRIAPDTPLFQAEKIADTGDTTRISFLKSDVPAEADLDTGTLKARWELSRHQADFTLTLEQPARGIKHTVDLDFRAGGGDMFTAPFFDWDGTIGAPGAERYAPPGQYTWTLKATPWDGIGPAATETGTFTVKRAKSPHDWTENGSPDLLVTDGAGRLWREDTHNTWVNGAEVFGGVQREQVGTGWDKYDRIESVGVQQGRTAVVARDTTGGLWLHHENGFGSPDRQETRIGGGWQVYDRIASGSDIDADGITDMVAVQPNGDLYYYKGTGRQNVPFAPKFKNGWGWHIYNEITAVGNIAGGPAGDLVARDKAGVLWLYQGKGDGTFAARVRIGGGWNEYTQLVGIGDGNRDGRADLYAYGPNGRTFFYAGTGQAATPFKPRTASTVLSVNSTDYKVVF
ncbi:VCBS repeat-containing protein [Streptomyces sp. NPDC006798]|uniref:FG-GAP repeat domain-containing protein n=1 Tax=Streptomyces sp. NPDC006798 TaxID=3155462 RepID=UPI00340B7804